MLMESAAKIVNFAMANIGCYLSDIIIYLEIIWISYKGKIKVTKYKRVFFQRKFFTSTLNIAHPVYAQTYLLSLEAGLEH